MITFSQGGAPKIMSKQFSEFGSRTNILQCLSLAFILIFLFASGFEILGPFLWHNSNSCTTNPRLSQNFSARYVTVLCLTDAHYNYAKNGTLDD